MEGRNWPTRIKKSLPVLLLLTFPALSSLAQTTTSTGQISGVVKDSGSGGGCRRTCDCHQFSEQS